MPKDQPASASPEPEKRPSPRRPPATASETQLPSFIGAFKISRLIGKDAFGVIYEGAQEIPARSAAVKVIRPDYFSAGAQKRFSFLAEPLVRLSHPGLAAVYAASVIETQGGKQPYFAAELIAGEPLETYASLRTLSMPRRLSLMAQVADAVHAAHVAGIVHRALNPAAILVSRDGQPRILDVGVAHLTDADLQAVALNADLALMLPIYSFMAPEQTAGKAAVIDIRADVYSLGVIACHILTGRLPYDIKRPTVPEALAVIREQPAARLSDLNRALGGDVEAIVARAMEKDKSQRYQSAFEFAADIRRFISRHPIAARPATPGYRAVLFARRHAVLIAAAALVLIALLAGMLVSALRASRAKSSELAALAQTSDRTLQLQRAQAQAADAHQLQSLAVQDAAQAKQAAEEAQRQLQAAQQADEDDRVLLQSAEAELKRVRAAAVAPPAGTQPARAEAPSLAAEASPQLLDALLSQAEALAEAGRHDQAIDCISAARALAVGNPAAARRLDRILPNLLLQFPPPLYHNAALKGATRQISLLPDGKTLLVSDLRDIVLVEASTGVPLRRFTPFAPNIRDVAVSSDGSLLAATAPGAKRQLVVISLPDGKQLPDYSDRPVIAGLLFAPQRPIIALDQPGRITLFDAHDLTHRVVRDIDNLQPRLAFSRDGNSLFAATAAHQILVLNSATLQTTSVINTPGEDGLLTPLAATDGSLFVASDAGLIRHLLPGYSTAMQYPGAYGAASLALSPSTRLLAAFSGGQARVYETLTGQELHAFADNHPPQSVGDPMAFTSDNGVLFDLDFYSGLRAWPLSTPRFPSPMGSHNTPVRALAVSPDGRLGISSAADHTAVLWDLPSQMPLAALGGAGGTCESFAFSNDAFSFRSVSLDGRLCLWDLHGRVAMQARKLPDAALSALAISRDGQTFAAGGPADSPLLVGSLASDQSPAAVAGPPTWAEFNELQFSSDGQWLLANTSAGPELFDAHSLKRAKLDRSIAGANLFAFSQDGSVVFAGMDTGQIVRWSLAASTGQSAALNAGAITCLCQTGESGGTGLLAVGGADRAITLADPGTLQPLTRLIGLPGPVTHLAFSPDSNWLMASAGNDVFLFDLRPGSAQLALADDAQNARTILDSDPKNAEALLKLGLYYADRHADAWAVELLTRARAAGAVVPSLPLARSLWRAHQWSLAADEFRRAIDQKEAPDDYLKLCLQAVANPLPIAAVRHFGG